jgi:hypothetical protein
MPVFQSKVSNPKACQYGFLLPDGGEEEFSTPGRMDSPVAICNPVDGSIRLSKGKNSPTKTEANAIAHVQMTHTHARPLPQLPHRRLIVEQSRKTSYTARNRFPAIMQMGHFM